MWNALKPLVPGEMDMPEMALRLILSNPSVGTIIPGMRKIKHVQNNNIAVIRLAKDLNRIHQKKLKAHRWERLPTEWSQ
jgi:aryl-alcohol dehydrogenase-like predicted oxidoreductase